MNAPQHEPIVRIVRRKRFLDWLGSAFLGLAMWSIVGVIVALRVDAPGIAWDFVYALLGSGACLMIVGYVEGRLYG